MQEDITYTDKLSIACNGYGYSGHPRVYLDLAKKGEIVCPYCSHKFILVKDTQQEE
ncbi:zinc-finger domain-containing protein [Candidatus Nucleicultrix amoebiphila]|jgi:uncharacterized Zn-finger protein|uniref:zinc-finger domain-containing protein n=1 Tax=Candidatus Nucleicultrix amoebiphila TaxID=1509244 RepID=UPI000A2722CB